MWFLPSLGRPQRLQETLDRISAIGVSTPGLVLVGPDDPLPERLPQGWRAEWRTVECVRLIPGLNAAFARFPDEPWYGTLGDDTDVLTLGWDVKLVEAAGPLGLASGNDDWQFHNKRLAGATVFGGDLLRAAGFWFPPMLVHCFGDDLWEEIGSALNIWRRLAHVRFRHESPLRERSEADATFKLGYSDFEGQRAAYAAFRRSAKYVEVLERISAAVEAMRDADPVLQRRLARARSRSVMIATPIARDPCWQYTLAFAETAVMLEKLGIRYTSRFVVGSSNLPRTRNELVARFLASGFDDLICIDDDMGWEANALLRLLASDKPLIGGVGRKRVDKPNTDPDVWCAHFGAFGGVNLQRDDMGAVQVERVGTGFLKISRSVFESLIAAHPDWKRDGPAHLDAETRAKYHRFFAFDENERGEDFAFCDAWRALGGEVWIDPEITLGHVGSKAYCGAIAEIMVAEDDDEQRAAA